MFPHPSLDSFDRPAVQECDRTVKGILRIKGNKHLLSPYCILGFGGRTNSLVGNQVLIIWEISNQRQSGLAELSIVPGLSIVPHWTSSLHLPGGGGRGGVSVPLPPEASSWEECWEEGTVICFLETEDPSNPFCWEVGGTS